MKAKVKKLKGEFTRSESTFRNWVTKDGSPGSSGVGDFIAEPGRYPLCFLCLSLGTSHPDFPCFERPGRCDFGVGSTPVNA